MGVRGYAGPYLFNVPGKPFLASVLEGTDAHVWARIVEHYLPARAVVVDLTYRDGRIWTGAGRHHPEVRVIALDLDQSEGGVDAFADCRRPPLRPLLADAVVFNPPWGEGAERSGYAGAEDCGRFTRVEQVLALVRPEAWARLVRPDGYLFVHCSDYHSDGYFVDLSTELILALRPGWEMWDRVIHVVGARSVRHRMAYPPKTRGCHAYFLVFRRRGAPPPTLDAGPDEEGGPPEDDEDVLRFDA